VGGSALPFKTGRVQEEGEALLPERAVSSLHPKSRARHLPTTRGWWTGRQAGAFAADVLNRIHHGDGGIRRMAGFTCCLSYLRSSAAERTSLVQEVPDPATTVMWNTWIEINPETAEDLGIQDQDVVQSFPTGSVEATVYRYPAIRPDTVAMPFGQGHTAYGRFAEKRGANPMDLMGTRTNAAGDAALGSMKVRIERTGRRRELARLEGALGVYGFDAK
jgi:hypothetical protein